MVEELLDSIFDLVEMCGLVWAGCCVVVGLSALAVTLDFVVSI